VEPDLPADLKLRLGAVPFEAEASLRGHLKNGAEPESAGSVSYVPKNKENDKQLKAAIDLLHGKTPPISQSTVEQVRATPENKTFQGSAAKGG
ncbi:MAG TPA: peptidase S41, partial [Hyphomicrobiales bacterium]|nr:peptidase S41 [Hyphomicrobiales bacterium]